MKQIIFNNEKLSKLSLGTVQFGLDYGIANSNGQPSSKEVDNIIEYVYANNINCFDTAQAYGNSESIISNSIKNKDNLFIISKLKSSLFKENYQENVSKSLNNLMIDSLYGLLLHDSELLHNWKNEYTLAVSNLIKENQIKYFGVSIYSNEDFELAIENPNITFIQIPFNIFDQRAIKKNWFKKAKEKNKLIFIRSVFLQGLLLMDMDSLPDNLSNAKKYLIKFNKYCHKLNISKSQLALNFVNTVAKDSILLFGCDTIEQAKENIENYNNLVSLDIETLESIFTDFMNIEENIYNPTKW